MDSVFNAIKINYVTILFNREYNVQDNNTFYIDKIMDYNGMEVNIDIECIFGND